jgi:hypothetical protein
LFDCREAIRKLEDEEAKLRDHLIRNPADRVGNEYHALVRVSDRKKIDLPGLLAAVGQEMAARFTSSRPVQTVVLTPVRSGSARRPKGRPSPAPRAG